VAEYPARELDKVLFWGVDIDDDGGGFVEDEKVRFIIVRSAVVRWVGGWFDEERACWVEFGGGSDALSGGRRRGVGGEARVMVPRTDRRARETQPDDGASGEGSSSSEELACLDTELQSVAFVKAERM
jgi:hypothetical protein